MQCVVYMLIKARYYMNKKKKLWAYEENVTLSNNIFKNDLLNLFRYNNKDCLLKCLDVRFTLHDWKKWIDAVKVRDIQVISFVVNVPGNRFLTIWNVLLFHTEILTPNPEIIWLNIIRYNILYRYQSYIVWMT